MKRITATQILILLFAGIAWGRGTNGTVRYEAENGQLIGTRRASSPSGYSGSGYVTGFDEPGDRVQVALRIGEAGLYDVRVGYRSPHGDKTEYLLVNGDVQGQILFAQSNSFTRTRSYRVWLESGNNTIGVEKYWGYANVDYFELTLWSPPALEVTPVLADANALPCVKNLMATLVSHYGNSILAGHYNTDDLPWIQERTGKQPALLGFDMINYSPSRVDHGATSTDIEDAQDWAAAGGIVQFQWHWNAPKDLLDIPGSEWWRGFYTYATTFDVAAALADPKSEGYRLLLRDMDTIATELQRLQDANVPVLWRPLHEAEGAWFWWGAQGAAACKKLYRLMFDRFTHVHQLHNLIWVWTSTDSENALDWYPGDDVVDVIGADIYLPGYNTTAATPTFYNLVELYGGEKLVALTENSVIPDPDRLILEGAGWSWFMTWRTFLYDGNSNTPEHVEWVYDHNYVTTLDELADYCNVPDEDDLNTLLLP